MVTRDIIYSVDDLNLGADFNQSIEESTPQFANYFDEGVSAASIGSGDMKANIQQKAGVLYNTKTAFDNTQTGYRLGIDSSDGLAKFYIGNTTAYLKKKR